MNRTPSQTRPARLLASVLAVALPALAAPAAAQGSVSLDVPWEFQYFQLNINPAVAQLRITLVPGVMGEADLYLRHGAPPTVSEFDHRSVTLGAERLLVNGQSAPPIDTGTWWIGVLRQPGTPFDLDWYFDPLPSVHAGLGANVYDDGRGDTGTGFRVWAPFAKSVRLSGDFNNWSIQTNRMASEGNGYWSLDARVDAGTAYKYVVEHQSGALVQKNDPRARQVSNSVGHSIVVDPDSYTWNDAGYGTPGWNELVIYEMHLGTFEDLPGPAVGTLDSARQRLPYLADLGVNAVQLMPISEFAGDSSWGYNAAHPFTVESAYGSPDDFREFVDAAHQQGIAVLLDVLHNHWGPSDMDLWQFDGWSENGYGGIYFYNDGKAVTPWGDTRPDFGRAEVREYIRDNTLFWLNEYRVDGFRWDSTSNIRKTNFGDNPDGWSLLQWINDEIDFHQGWKINIAEDMFDAPNDWITKDTGAGGAGFDSQWDAMFVHPIREAVITPWDADRNMWAVRNAIAHSYNGDAFERVIYSESHDEVANGKSRVPEEIWPGNASSYYSKKRSTLAASIVLTSPGIPMLFQGQEFLEDEFFSDDDPLDWSKLTTFSGIHALYRDLIRLRRNWFDNTRGLRGNGTNVHHVNDFDKVIAFHRWDQGGPGDDVVVLSNFADRSWNNYRIGVPSAGTWYVRFNSDWDGYDASYDNHPTFDVTADAIPWDGMSHSVDLSFGRYTTLILSQ